MNAGIKGVHAPLSQLGKVNDDYSTAMEVAMGGRMRNIVVDDDETASIAIEILKSSQAGRATFLPLTKMKSRPWGMKVPKEPGVIDFAINLVEFDGKYESAFYYALGETLVVEDMNSARRLIGKYRHGTPDGSLLEKTGAMTGGSLNRVGVKFAQSEDNELKTMKERLEKFQDKLATLDNKKKETENRLDDVRRDYSEAMTELNRKRFELENFDKNTKDGDLKIIKSEELIKTKTPELEENKTLLQGSVEGLQSFAGKINQLAKEIEAIRTPCGRTN